MAALRADLGMSLLCFKRRRALSRLSRSSCLRYSPYSSLAEVEEEDEEADRRRRDRDLDLRRLRLPRERDRRRDRERDLDRDRGRRERDRSSREERRLFLFGQSAIQCHVELERLRPRSRVQIEQWLGGEPRRRVDRDEEDVEFRDERRPRDRERERPILPEGQETRRWP